MVISYQQIIHAYPGGGGAYIVAYDNLGRFPALVAASVLLMDYVLGVSVSISSGVAQIVSAFPQLYDYRVPLCVGFVALITIVNLRGVRESGAGVRHPQLLLYYHHVHHNWHRIVPHDQRIARNSH